MDFMNLAEMTPLGILFFPKTSKKMWKVLCHEIVDSFDF